MLYLKNLFDSIENLHVHLRRHESSGELTDPVQCCQDNCCSCFKTVWNLRKHMFRYHVKNSEPNIHAVPHAGDQQVGSMHDCDVEMVPVTDAQSEQTQEKYSLSDIQTEGVALVASLRSNSSLPSKVIPEIVSSFNHMSECTVNHTSHGSVRVL